MTDAAFDTLAVTRQLKARGFDSDQAEAITEAVRTGVTGGIATKADIAEVKADIAEVKANVGEAKADIAELKIDVGEVKADIAELKANVGEVKADIAELKVDVGEVKADIVELRTDLRWVKAIGAGIIGILIVAFGFVFNMLTELSTGLAALASGG